MGMITELVKEPSTWVTVVITGLTGFFSWMGGKKSEKAKIRQTLSEVDLNEAKVEEKYRQLESDKYLKLINRAMEQEKMIDDFVIRMQAMSNELKELKIEHQQTIAELNMYKTIKTQ